MPAIITPIDFMQILKSYDIIIPALDHQPTSNNLFVKLGKATGKISNCLLYTSPSPRDGLLSRMPSSA